MSDQEIIEHIYNETYPVGILAMEVHEVMEERDKQKRAWRLYDDFRLANGFEDGASDYWLFQAAEEIENEKREKIHGGKVC
jgi:hypothetical protein